jgi:hypothetical protein
MLYVDLPTRPEFLALREKRADACVSIYVETTPLSQHVDASRTQMANLFKTGREQLEAAGFDKRRMAALTELIDDLLDDDEFWRLQANSLAVFATPDTLQTFRLANRLSPMVRVSDRLHLNPRHCQTNLNRPAKGAAPRRSSRQLPPLGQGGGTVLSEDVAAIEVTVLIEMIMDRGVDGGKLLHSLYVPELRHRTLSSSERLM